MARMENDRFAKRVCEGECAGSRSVGRPRKRWTNIVKDCLRKRCLDVRQLRRMLQDRSEWGEGHNLDRMPQLCVVRAI